MNPCRKPSGWPGRFVLWLMNLRHSRVTDWGLGHVLVEKHYTILDVGCGGGRTVSKLAAKATEGKVCGVDFSPQSVAVSKKTNAHWIEMKRVEIREAPVTQLPYSDATFDLVTAVETHFWWDDLPGGLREILRVLKPGGTLLIVAEIYNAASLQKSNLAERVRASGMKLLSVDEHRELFEHAGYSDVRVETKKGSLWICAGGRKP